MVALAWLKLAAEAAVPGLLPSLTHRHRYHLSSSAILMQPGGSGPGAEMLVAVSDSVAVAVANSASIVLWLHGEGSGPALRPGGNRPPWSQGLHTASRDLN